MQDLLAVVYFLHLFILFILHRYSPDIVASYSSLLLQSALPQCYRVETLHIRIKTTTLCFAKAAHQVEIKKLYFLCSSCSIA